MLACFASPGGRCKVSHGLVTPCKPFVVKETCQGLGLVTLRVEVLTCTPTYFTAGQVEGKPLENEPPLAPLSASTPPPVRPQLAPYTPGTLPFCPSPNHMTNLPAAPASRPSGVPSRLASSSSAAAAPGSAAGQPGLGAAEGSSRRGAAPAESAGQRSAGGRGTAAAASHLAATPHPCSRSLPPCVSVVGGGGDIGRVGAASAATPLAEAVRVSAAGAASAPAVRSVSPVDMRGQVQSCRSAQRA